MICNNDQIEKRKRKEKATVTIDGHIFYLLKVHSYPETCGYSYIQMELEDCKDKEACQLFFFSTNLNYIALANIFMQH